LNDLLLRVVSVLRLYSIKVVGAEAMLSLFIAEQCSTV